MNCTQKIHSVIALQLRITSQLEQRHREDYLQYRGSE
jgi:hypothetical protein